MSSGLSESVVLSHQGTRVWLFCSLTLILNILLSVSEERHQNQNHKRRRLEIKYVVPCKINSSWELRKRTLRSCFVKICNKLKEVIWYYKYLEFFSRNCHCNAWINKEDLYSSQADTSEQWSISHYPLLCACLILCAILSKNIPDLCLCALLMMLLWNVLRAKLFM